MLKERIFIPRTLSYDILTLQEFLSSSPYIPLLRPVVHTPQ